MSVSASPEESLRYKLKVWSLVKDTIELNNGKCRIQNFWWLKDILASAVSIWTILVSRLNRDFPYAQLNCEGFTVLTGMHF